MRRPRNPFVDDEAKEDVVPLTAADDFVPPDRTSYVSDGGFVTPHVERAQKGETPEYEISAQNILSGKRRRERVTVTTKPWLQEIAEVPDEDFVPNDSDTPAEESDAPETEEEEEPEEQDDKGPGKVVDDGEDEVDEEEEAELEPKKRRRLRKS